MHNAILNVKTNYELLGSLIIIDDLISFALKNSITTIGVTDSNMFSCMEFYNKCIKNDIKPVVGVDLQIDDVRFILYAKNYEGYKELCKIVSEKNLNDLRFEFLKENNTNLICVCAFEYINNYDKLKEVFGGLYVSYKNKEEKTSALIITENVFYSKEILYISESDREYMKYLSLIKDGGVLGSETSCEYDNHIDLDVDAIDIQSAIDFSEKLNLVFPKFEFNLPKYSDDSSNLLKSLCKKGLYKRLDDEVSEEYINRLTYEISIIEQMGYVDYFLIVYDFILYAKKNKILVGPGRGSSAGSLVCYTLGITDIDPIKYNLIFERFLNPERITMPDIDVDLSDVRREEVIEYVRNKYGHDKTANVITFGSLLPKQAIRNVGRVLNIDISEIDKICKFVNDKESFEDLRKNKLFVDFIKVNKEYIKLIDISKNLENLKRHTSIHAAGIVISKIPLNEIVPLYKSGSTVITGYSMNYLEELGLLKIDFLGISNLTTIDNIVKSIEKDTNKEINLNNIDLNDEETLNIFRNVNTLGVFQFESAGMRNLLRDFKVNSFDDLVVAIALFRPGPKDMIPHYIRRKEGKESVSYIFEDLKPILKSTNGIIVYQEQILEILKIIGGYSYAQADKIRRAMSKKQESIILKEKEIFVSSAEKKGYDRVKSIELFDLVLKFANYGFPKSHSVAYSLISYQMAYLKSKYREYFMINLLNMVKSSDTKTKEYIDEAKVMGLSFESININTSENAYVYKDGKIIFPLSIVKNISDNISKVIVEERKMGNFKDFYDFMRRVYSPSINKKSIESLIEVGAFSSFNININTLLNNLDKFIDYASLCKKIDYSLVLLPEINEFDEMNKSEILELEFENLGFYMSDHPVTKYSRHNMVLLNDAEKYFNKNINTIVLVENIKTILTKNKEKMAFLCVSDEFKKIDSTIFPKIYDKYIDLKEGDIIKMNARVERRYDKYQLVINSLEILK